MYSYETKTTKTRNLKYKNPLYKSMKTTVIFKSSNIDMIGLGLLESPIEWFLDAKLSTFYAEKKRVQTLTVQ